jgi:hypothetical protein
MVRCMLGLALGFVGMPMALASPWTAPIVNPRGVAEVRLVCDAWGRCWDQPDDGADAGPRYGDRYGPAYGEYERPRPSTKWEQKGFCPPGQRKKGTC